MKAHSFRADTRLSNREEEIGRVIVDCAYKVHVALGPGLLEKAYEACFLHQLRSAGLIALAQVPIAVEFDNIRLDVGFRADVIVENLVLCELKSVSEMHPIFFAQILNHMKLANVRLGYLINFNVTLIKDGIHRRVL